MLKNITNVSVGKSHSILLDKFGNVYGCGLNTAGQLGLTQTASIVTPQKIPLSNIKAISSGAFHSLFLDIFGNVFSTGDNSKGQLGIGNFINKDVPQKISSFTIATKISAGDDNSFILENGKVYRFGNNANGKLALNATENSTINSPSVIEGLNGINEISAGFSHSIVFNSTDAFVFGLNIDGQFGDGTYTNSFLPKRIKAPKDFVDIKAGTTYSLLLGKYGDIYGFGNDAVSILIKV